MTDEQFAKWLQDEEFRQQREGAAAQNQERQATERADAEYARRLASEEQRRQQQVSQPQQSRATPGLENAIALQHGQTIAIRLQHPGTRNQIDEALYAHHVDRNVMMFEMVRKRGTYLRVKDSSETEFSKIVDESSQFVVENTEGGMIYLGPRKHIQKVNLSGGIGWMLALSHNGSLIGNSSRCAMAQWRLLAAPDAPPYAPISGIAASSVPSSGLSSPTPPSSLSSPPAQTSQLLGTDSMVSNPLVSDTVPASQNHAVHNEERRNARVETQVQWLDSAVGQTWLAQDREGRGKLKLMHQEGKLRQLMYRPDWPKAALEWKDYASLHSDYLMRDYFSNDVQINFQEFFDKGYTVCPSVLTASLVSGALKMVNYWLGQYPNHPGINAQGNINLSGEILKDQALLALLYESPLLRSLRTFFKEDSVLKPCLECQISLRFPDYSPSDDVVGFGGKRWHIDSPDANGGYSILIGIPLSSTSSESESEGNLCVFPAKQNEVFEAWSAACAGGRTQRAAASASMSDVMDGSKVDFGEPDKLHLNAGDAVFMSQFTPHREDPNFSSHIAYMVYFRVSVASAIGEGDSGVQTDINQQYHSIWSEFSTTLFR